MKAAIALGSNLDDPVGQVEQALRELDGLPGTSVLARSKLHRTKPVGYANQPDFVNACALVETQMAPRALLDALLDIERAHGRVREIPNGPRTLDLDILLLGDFQINEPGLEIPHPRLAKRAFVLVPLNEIAPEAIDPRSGKKMSELLKRLTDDRDGDVWDEAS